MTGTTTTSPTSTPTPTGTQTSSPSTTRTQTLSPTPEKSKSSSKTSARSRTSSKTQTKSFSASISTSQTPSNTITVKISNQTPQAESLPEGPTQSTGQTNQGTEMNLPSQTPGAQFTSSPSSSPLGGCFAQSGSIVCSENQFRVNIPDQDFPSVIVTEVDLSSLPDSPNANFGSKVFDVSFVNETLTDFSVELCFISDSSKDACLGYFDEIENDWKCEDKCLDQNQDGQLCGNTSHFTNFAILLGGGGSGSDQCSSFNTYVTGHFIGDLILDLGCAGLCVFCGLLIIFLSSFTARGRKFVLGPEGSRVSNLRTHASTQVEFVQQ
jgi:hypothetical protein